MPTSTEILRALAEIANSAVAFAIAFHVLLALAFAAWAAGLRLPRTAAVVVTVAPLAAVAVFASRYGVLFNAVVFAALTIALLVLGLRAAQAWRTPASTGLALLGGVLLGFGVVYPHFLDNSHGQLAYLYASPLGLLPCPTLAFLIGLSLSAGSAGGRGFARVLAGAGLFYGAWGVLKLGVWIDGVLFIGALALLLATRSAQRREAQTPRAAAPLHAPL